MPKAARVLGVGVRTAYREAHSGTIPSVTIGRRLVVPTHKLFAMLGLDVESGAPAPADRAAAGCGEPATAV
jgi:excisionase family DNA binding protein